MSVTREELEDFTHFASERLVRGDYLTSLEECLRQWRADRDFQEAVADIQQSLEDCARGHRKPIDQAFDDMRQRLGMTP